MTHHSSPLSQSASSAPVAQTAPPAPAVAPARLIAGRTLKAEARSFSFSYGTFTAVKALSLPFPERTVTALIGPSGCGKTTFLRCFNRMHDLYPGNKYEGELILHPDKVNIVGPGVSALAMRMRIGMVFQKPNPFPKSIFENVAYGLRLRGVSKSRDLEMHVEKALKGAALWDEVKDRLKKPGSALSGGQQQRLCIARALATEPELLLFDEPTSALDPIATAKIEELMHQLRERVTIIIVTHNMQQAARVSDYTAFMYLGKLVEHNKTIDIFQNPREPLTEQYVTGRFG
ncbi:MAG TPA: phosphate ABC transporter ATP-binding protein PstB [Phycisphaerales bacterium]|nr:phosphate ABC transporter ATP-binding protein PstB [Phycisphaerales bacterium]